MYFLYPNFLWALSLLAIPIIIHFFNIRRYKRVYFSHTQIIKSITQQSQVKNKLKEYLILIERLLAMLFLILAFAQPTLHDKKQNIWTQKHGEVVIYIDNSFSMENIGNYAKLFETAIGKAKEILSSFSKSAKFIILTNDSEIKSEKALSRDEALERLSKIKISYSSIPISLIIKRIKSFHLSNPVVFLISDGQKKSTDIQNISQKIKIPIYYFLLSPTQKNNISIDSVWLDNPVFLLHQPQQLHIKLSNHHHENAEGIPIKVSLNNTQVAILNVSIPAHQTIETTTSFVPKDKSFQFGKVFINDYPVVFDDEIYFAINADIHLKALLINGSKENKSAKYIRTFFQNDSLFLFSEQKEEQLNFSEITQQDIVILNEITEYSSGLEEQLKILSKQGKIIIIIPYIENNKYVLPSVFNQFQWDIDTTQQNINVNILQHPLLKGVFEKTDNVYKMPIVKEYIDVSSHPYIEPIVELNNGQPLLFKYEENQESYWVFTSTLNADKNKLSLHAIFVPLMYRLCFRAIPYVPLYYYCGVSENIKLPNILFNTENPPKLISTNNDDNFQIIPMYKNHVFYSTISIPNNIQINPGYYYLQWKNKNIFPLSFNYNRAESDMQFYSEKEIKDAVKQQGLNNFYVNDISSIPVKKIIQAEISGTSYWKLCLILALIFFIAESLTIRIMK